ncbi:MAG TPA: ABC transporter permease, partial [Acetobacteraceae bacterium]|nr:ABC transporter permease [Acetobacteraceae bacterium]
GLDQPVPLQYVLWLGNLLHGNLGNSLVNDYPVSRLIAQRLPVALQLTVGSLLIGCLLGALGGIIAGVRRNSLLVRLVDLANATAIAVPVFWLGLLLQILVAVKLGWLPAGGYVSFSTNPLGCLRSLVLPCITLGVGTAAVLARFLSNGIRETISNDFILAARAKGLPPRRILLKHVLRNAFIPAITALGIQFGRLIGGAVLTEAVFNLPGLGMLLWTALVQRDYFVIQAVTLLAVAAFIVVNLATDIAYGVIDPRIRAGRY